MIRFAGFLTAVGFLSLVTNRTPLVTVACFGLGGLLALQPPKGVALAVLAVWAFWGLSFLSTFESFSTFASFDFHRRDGQIFFSLLPIVAMAWVAQGTTPFRLALALFCVVQAAVALLACGAEILGRTGTLEGMVYLRDESESVLNYCGLYRAHNAVGSVQALCCLAAVAMAAFGAGARMRLFWGLLSIPLFWGVILSKSRGSLLALAGALAGVAVLSWMRGAVSRRAILGVALVAVATGALFGPRVVARMGQFAERSGTHAWRWEQWKRAAQEWSWSPIVGEGLGRYNDEDRQWAGLKHFYFVVTKARVVNAPSHAHNSYLHFLSEGGLAGFCVTVGFWAWIAWKLRGSREPLRIAAFLGVLYLFAISLTEHYMGGGAMLLVLSSLVGAAWNLPEPPLPDKIAAA